MFGVTAQRPLFSIVTITYNDLAGFRETAASVAGQTFKNFEWIVVDGGSTDGTLDFLDVFPRRPDQRISEPDKGIYDAMNKGIERASGVYTIFMNGGDRF